MSGKAQVDNHRWWWILLRPGKAFASLFTNRSTQFNLLNIFLGGIALVQIWSSALALGDDFEVGKIMTVTLILGPLVGLMFCSLGAFFSMAMGNLLDPEHRVKYQHREFTPPLPLKNLLWKRIFGREKIKALFRHPALRWYAHLWSGFRSGLAMLWGNLTGGKIRYGQMFTAFSAAMTVMLLADLLMVFELAFFEADHFSSTGEGGIRLVFAMAKYAFVVWFLVLCFLAVKNGFQHTFVRNFAGSLLAILLTVVVLLQLLTQLFALPVFGI